YPVIPSDDKVRGYASAPPDRAAARVEERLNAYAVFSRSPETTITFSGCCRAECINSGRWQQRRSTAMGAKVAAQPTTTPRASRHFPYPGHRATKRPTTCGC